MATYLKLNVNQTANAQSLVIGDHKNSFSKTFLEANNDKLSVTYSVGDQKGLLCALHAQDEAHSYGIRNNSNNPQADMLPDEVWRVCQLYIKQKNIPIIMITSRVGEKHRARAMEAGVDEYLGKPYQESQLLAAIEALTSDAPFGGSGD